MRSLHVTLWPLHVSMRYLHISWGPMQTSRWPLHVAHPIVVWPVAVCPGWGPHHPTLRAHHVPLRLHHAPLRWGTLRTHPSRRGAHHATMGPLHPSGSHTVRPLGAHISRRTWVSLHTLGPLHVWGSHHGPLVRLRSRRWPHLSRGHERRLHASGAHWGPHVVGHLLRRHVWWKALLAGRHRAPGPPREGGHWALSLRGPHISICAHPVHLHLLQREPNILTSDPLEFN